jgi:hypothetical protein
MGGRNHLRALTSHLHQQQKAQAQVPCSVPIACVRAATALQSQLRCCAYTPTLCASQAQAQARDTRHQLLTR